MSPEEHTTSAQSSNPHPPLMSSSDAPPPPTTDAPPPPPPAHPPLMTADTFFEKFFKGNLEKERDKQIASFTALSVFNEPLVEDVIKLTERERKLKERKVQLAAISIKELNIDVKSIMSNFFSQDIAQQASELARLEQQADEQMHSVELKKQQAVEKLERALTSLRAEYDEAVSDVYHLQASLSEKAPVAQNILKLYNIPVVPDSIAYEELSLDDIRTLAFTADSVVSHMSSRSLVLDSTLKLLYFPLELKVEDEIMRTSWKLLHFAILATLAFLSPYVMATVGLFYILYILSNLLRVRDRKELLQFCYEVSDNLDLDKFFYSTDEYQEVSAKLEKAKALDLTPYLSEIERNKENSKQAVIDRFRLEERQEELQTLFNTNVDRMASEIQKAMQLLNERKRLALSGLDSLLKETQNKLEEQRAKCRPLGTIISKSPVLDVRLKTGFTPEQGAKIHELEQPLELKNTIFFYKDDFEKQGQIEHIQFQMVNYLASVKYAKLGINIYDEHELGRDFSDFYSKDLGACAKIETEKLQSILTDMIKETKDNVTKIGRTSIGDYNADAYSKGMLTIGYKLLIIISSNTNLFGDKLFMSLLGYSASAGYLIWWLLKKPEKEEEVEVVQEVYDKDCYFSCKPYSMGYLIQEGVDPEDDSSALGHDLPPNYAPYKYAPELGKSIMSALQFDFDNDPGDVRFWDKTYRDVIFPPDKIWKGTTQNGINLRLGFRDGDPAQTSVITLADAPVHALAAGATGAGKSATANAILANLFHEYPPSELEIIMIDFKNAEFPMYTKKPNPSFDPALGKRDPEQVYFDPDPNPMNIYMSIPHAKVISGTKDGEYALSIFQYLNAEMDRRAAIFRRYNVQNIADYNKLARKGQAEGIMPRILFFVDEFTVMFTEVTPKVLIKIEKEIISLANLARFCGCHMWFQTQDFTGTMPKKVMGQFTLRVCLRAGSDVAEAVMKTKLPALLPKRGQCYSNESMGEDQSTTKRWIIPFITGDVMNEYMPNLSAWAEGSLDGNTYPDRKPPFYDENRKHILPEVGEWHEEFPEVLKETPRLVLLGETTVYDASNVIPINFKLIRDDAENVAILTDDRTMMIHLINTFIYNAQLKTNPPAVIASVMDRDNYNLINIESKIDPRWVPLAHPGVDFETLYTVFSNLINSRKTRSLEEISTPVYILCVNWERLLGFGRDQKTPNINKFITLLKEGPGLNVHFIFGTKQMSIFRDLIPNFNHRITSKCDDSKSLFALMEDDVKVEKDFAVYKKSDELKKFKVYYSPITGTIEETSVKIGARRN